MVTVTLEEEKLTKTNFKNLKDLFNYANENNLLKGRQKRDKYGFTEKAGKDLKQIRKDSKKGKNISKPYSNLGKLLSDLKNNEVNYN